MLHIAISSRVLFNLEDGHALFEAQGLDAFNDYMLRNEAKPLRPGVGFELVRKLLALNTPGQVPRVEVLLLSSNTLEAGARVMSSVQHYGLAIERAFFTSGGDRFKLAKAAGVTLFLSTNAGEVRNALAAGIAAACVQPNSRTVERSEVLRLAFDGDAVLFSDEAEHVFQAGGLSAFNASEQHHAHVPLGAGPFKPVLEALHGIQEALKGECGHLRVALVTARSVAAHRRVLETFRHWGVQVNEAYFCAGMPKGPVLEAFGADLFFDDGLHNIDSAAQFVPAGHVPAGVRNQSAAFHLAPSLHVHEP